MARWKPDAAQRLMAAALELFEERGYESATVQEITERAGLTKSSFFRHFPNKREVLFDGEAMATTLVEGIAAAPDDAAPWDALTHAFARVGAIFMTPQRHDFLARRAAVIARTPELREREALKQLGLIAAMIDALTHRSVPDLQARVLAELSAVAFAIAYKRWLAMTSSDNFADILRDAIDEVRCVISTT
ncbi:TetR/AcrR family transcriptional regulator [Nocardia fusca]|uniref:TetR/AcrR family transcriptional regulator n=1 Tax=Nocardia fusca TaxID=941183 RepID=UPI0007A74FC5|nr:TetR/AcrR family transcriptional regulator [Nocardia fusca]